MPATPRILHVHFKTRHNVGDAAVVLAIRELVNARLGRTRWSSLPVRTLREPPTPRMLRFINGHAAVIIGGGGFCSKHALPLDERLVAAIEPPITLFGVGHNRHLDDPGLDERQRASLGLLAKRARLIGVRDRVTQALFAGLGAAATLTGDPAIFLRPARPWWGPRRRRPRAFGFNLACHGWTGQQARLEPLLDIYREVIDTLGADGAADLWYLVHADAERDVARRLHRACPRLRICRLAPAQLLHTYGQLDLVVSMMLHSSLFAFAAGVPVVNLAYDEKNRAFLEDIGHPERCLPAATATARDVLDACRQALAEPDQAAAAAVRERYAAVTREFVERFADTCLGRTAR